MSTSSACNEFVEIDFSDASSPEYKDYTRAAHSMFYALDPHGKLWEFNRNALIMMQMRFDGMVGFPGGIVENNGEKIHEGLNRELVEEINLDVKRFALTEDNHFKSHISTKRKLITHFYVKKLSVEEFNRVERSTLDAEEWGLETAGTIRVPMYILKDGYTGLPAFLCNLFAGNAQEQLIQSIREHCIIPEELLDKAITAYVAKCEQK